MSLLCALRVKVAVECKLIEVLAQMVHSISNQVHQIKEQDIFDAVDHMKCEAAIGRVYIPKEQLSYRNHDLYEY